MKQRKLLPLVLALALQGCQGITPTAEKSPVSIPRAYSSSDCKVDRDAEAVKSAAESLLVDPGWGSHFTVQGPMNYNPCTTLSGATVLPEGSTGYGPWNILLFHNGKYVGPATHKAYRDAKLDVSKSTDDTVVVEFRWPVGDECHACETGVGYARFKWQDDKVEQLDPIPSGALPWPEDKEN